MMTSTLKWMALGAVLGFSVATGVSCGPAKCTARNCAFGCCDATGVCQTGNSDSQCGQAGAVCAQCVLGQSCSFGRCGLNGAGGSSGGGTGGSSGGGGGGGTGGGTTDALCTRLNSASISFFAGRTVCTDGMSTISQGTSGLARCNAGITQCAAADRTSLATYSGCLETGRVCTPGNEGSAISNFTSCVTTLSSNISQPCSAALFSSSSGGGGGGTPVGGGAGGGTPQGGGTGAGGGGIGGGTGAGPSGGGGGASNCATLGATYSSFMAGRSICTNGTASVNADPTIASRCASGCFTTNDQAGVQSFSTCLTGTTCFTGNETTALSTFQNCAASILSGLSSPCQAALSTGAAGGGTGGGGGVGTTLLNITISGALDSTTNYTFTVPSGTTSLTITTQGGTGDVDLFLSRLTIPTVAVNDSSSQNTGNAETLFLPSPTAGVWHLMALGYAAYAGVTLTIIAQ